MQTQATDFTKTYYDVERRTTNHPDTFTSGDVLWDTRERAEQEAERLRKWWPPLLEARVVEWKS